MYMMLVWAPGQISAVSRSDSLGMLAQSSMSGRIVGCFILLFVPNNTVRASLEGGIWPFCILQTIVCTQLEQFEHIKMTSPQKSSEYGIVH